MYDSRIHRLPPELLAAVASHLEDGGSLVAATHVCHFWRTSLLSSPGLWSFLDFTNEERALVYLERSKSAPLRISSIDFYYPSEIVKESLNQVAARVTKLRAAHGPLLGELLAHPMPKLEALKITISDELPLKNPAHFPSLTSLVISGFDPLQFYTPILTSFHLIHDPGTGSVGWSASVLLNFFRNCPLLEVASLSCDMDPSSDEAVSLPLLRSFTHKSRRDKYQLCLLNRLSLPSTCRVVLMIDVEGYYFDPWTPGSPLPETRPTSRTSGLSRSRLIRGA